MGIGGISIWQLLIILAIIVLLFGTKKLRGIGSDLGGAVKGFKKAVSDEDKQSDAIQNKSESDKVTDSEKKHDKV
ncbi:MAG: Sec-independent protein translocase subunit TatA [Pseudoalteromonas spongiae]|mgnify:CR=1 FL=1|uniref:Sec-independent protein translocase subunit TatA n=1 Tax=Pseudoalteromonas TaxID=53246 RepID=UPI00026C912E|nr:MULTISPECIES: Sec-independent protein translocase subunit TatA [Pseudoalteromonas]ATC99938.1 sec-independent protein translocase protein TatA [Pseudoalteromonas spongiae UST010723-006]KPV98077.1 Sec-independent protein translocase protein TatA [Pseudoalteromonas sp. P1-9]MEC8328061.1 Sec-independent protein translocase subunit TatA [Pseudomonadota bacterium]TMO86706.1 twin-arginine translocase subunit TatA [Pseudoalteromonas spongiae]